MSIFDGLILPLAITFPILVFVIVIKLVLAKEGRNKRYPFDVSGSRRVAGQSILSDFNDKSADLFGHLIMVTVLFNLPFIYIGVNKLLKIDKEVPWLIIPIYSFVTHID